MKTREKHIICVCNQKGGVGKTTTVHDLAYLFGKEFKTLVIDLDTQITLSIFLDGEENMTDGVYDILDLMIDTKNNYDKLDVSKAIFKKNGFDFIYGSQEISDKETEFYDIKYTYLLRKLMEKLDYEVIIVDTHPDRRRINQLMYCACTDFIIPADSDRGSAEGTFEVLKNITEYYEEGYTKGKVLGVLQTRCDMRSSVWSDSRERLKSICDDFNARLFDTYIRLATDVYRCKEDGVSMNEFSPKNNAAMDYQELYKEIIKIWKKEKKGR